MQQDLSMARRGDRCAVRRNGKLVEGTIREIRTLPVMKIRSQQYTANKRAARILLDTGEMITELAEKIKNVRPPEGCGWATCRGREMAEYECARSFRRVGG